MSMRHVAPALASVLLLLASACNDRERLDEPYATLLPACEATISAPQLNYENQHNVKDGEFGLSYRLWERACEGKDFKLSMGIRQFESVLAAVGYFSHPPGDELGNNAYDLGDLVEPRYRVDEFRATGIHFIPSFYYGGAAEEFDFDEDDGFIQSWLQFRRGPYVGYVETSAKGEVILDEEIPDGFVAGDSHLEAAERLVNEVLRDWSLE